MPDKEFIEKELAKCGLYPTVAVFDETDSTNTRARELLTGTDTDLLVLASSQTEGKGSHGRSFYSPHDTGLYFTATFRGLGYDSPVTFAAAAAAEKALRRFGTDARVKWVNDIIVGGRKAGGILCERIPSGTVIVGIGINLEEPADGFPEDISATAGSSGTGRTVRDSLAVKLYRELAAEVRMDQSAVMDEYRSVCSTVGKRIRFLWKGEEIEGIAGEVADDGSLIVRTDSGEVLHLLSGNVSVRHEF